MTNSNQIRLLIRAIILQEGINEIESFKELPYKEYGLGDSPYNRWTESLYKMYVQRGEQNEYKHVSEEEFMKMTSGKMSDMRRVEMNKSDRHRIADEKIEFFDKNRVKLGEIWKEQVRDDSIHPQGEMMVSYWIRTLN